MCIRDRRNGLIESARQKEAAKQEVAKELQAAIEDRDSYRLQRHELKKKYKLLFKRWESAKSGLQDGQRQHSELQLKLEHAKKVNGKLNSLLEESKARLAAGESVGSGNTQEVESLRLEIERLRNGILSNEKQFKEFNLKFRKTHLKYKHYKAKMRECKILLEAYCRVTGIAPSKIAKQVSAASKQADTQVKAAADQSIDVSVE